MRKKICGFIGGIVLCILISGCAKKGDLVTSDLFSMDTYMTFSAYGEHASEGIESVKSRVTELDREISVGNEMSEISKVNQDGKGVLSKDIFELLQRSMQIEEDTKGAFCPLMEPIMELWGFTNQKYRVPTEQEITSALTLTHVCDMALDEHENLIELKRKGMKLDLGGITKGYASSEAVRIFKDAGVKSAMVNLGGNVQTLGTKPDGTKWRVAIENPDKSVKHLGIIELADEAVITSGGYERYFEENGKTYHHIIDPATGYPAESGLKSVSIICKDGTLADALSTALFVMGLDQATEYWQAHKGEFDVVFLTSSNQLYITKGIEKRFTSEFDYRVIE